MFAVTICGPTACGKTDLALALARAVSSEIISVDSALVYRGMDIGTAKPSATLLAQVPHHLIDLLDPAEHYSAGRFVRDARAALKGIVSRGRLPVLVGGTMLYFKALQEGLADLPEADWQWRASLDAEAAEVGWPALHQRLARLDPKAAARIQANDPQRIQRALEVYHLTGRPISALQTDQTAPPAVRYVNLGVLPTDRVSLAERIACRFDRMLDEGLIEEVRAFFERGDLTAETPAMRAVGYRQLWAYLAGQCSLEEAREAAIVATRRLAKRQLTWMRGRADLKCFEPFDPAALEWLVERIGEAED
jgi:tRNA dimethylallyltransferase